MSAPTPRTDEEAGSLIDAEEVVPADFARTLERELAAEREKVRVLQEAMKFSNQQRKLHGAVFDSCQLASSALTATKDKP